MLQANAYGDAFCLNFNLIIVEPAIDIACRMPCGKNDCRGTEGGSSLTFNPRDAVFLDEDTRHLRLEMHLTPRAKNGVKVCAW